ncbi:MAG: outer membrane protein transport protein [Gammaproteobacteria bacterium]|nr:outer membrane protein transport protein [Gammaproteobacteria bacterium]
MKFTKLALALAFMGITTQTYASDFSLPFVNVAGLGTAYADWATASSDASTAYTNPAGLVKLTHTQFVAAALDLQGSTRFTGSSTTPPYPYPFPVIQSGGASSRISAFIPSIYFSVPINNRFTFGFHQTAPFGLGSNYNKDAVVRYIATRSRVAVVDLGPDLGLKINENLSIGLGFDAARLAYNLDSMLGPPNSTPDSDSQDHLSGWGFGWHGGVLYQPFKATRLGASFNSQLRPRTTGDSIIFSPIGTFRTTNQKTNAGLPAHAQLSIEQNLTPLVTLMGTVFYTNWETFNQLTRKRVILPGGSTMSVTIPFNYHNTFDYSVGMSFKANSKLTVRTGVQLMNTPSNNRDRGVADPIGRGTVLAVGAHYQQNEKLGYDVGLGHSFFQEEPVNLVNSVSSATGHNMAQTSVFGAQVTWNIV